MRAVVCVVLAGSSLACTYDYEGALSATSGAGGAGGLAATTTQAASGGAPPFTVSSSSAAEASTAATVAASTADAASSAASTADAVSLSASGGCPSPCQAGSDFQSPTTCHCYRAVATNVTWGDAAQNCIGSLALVKSQQEIDELYPWMITAFPGGHVWIGLKHTAAYASQPPNCSNCNWCWQDGGCAAPATYTNWNVGEPTDQGTYTCVRMGSGGGWSTAKCSDALGQTYLCEYTP